jgi:hypothetical protein
MNMNTQFNFHDHYTARSSPSPKFSLDPNLEDFSASEKIINDFSRKQYKIPFNKLSSHGVCSLLAKEALKAPPQTGENLLLALKIPTQIAIYTEVENKTNKRLLRRVDKFFLKVFTKIFGESLRKTLRIVSLKDRKEWHNNYAENLMKERVSESQEAIANHRFSKLEKNPFMMPMEVKESLFVEEKLLKVPSEISEKDLHKATARLALLHESHLDVPNHFDLALGKMEAYSFDGDEMRIGEGIIPTSYQLGDEKKAKMDHLTNVYVLDLNDGKAVIRSGRIDTEQRAKDFINVIEDLSYKNHDTVLHVVSQQLNSYENESKMIDSQHRQISKANKILGNRAELIHINIPSNRWVNINKTVDSLGLLGKFIRALAPKKILKGERLSKKQNLDSWGTYVKWVAEDLKGVPGIDVPLQELNKNVLVYENLKKLVDDVLADPKPDSQKLKSLRSRLKENLQFQYNQLGVIEAALTNDDPTSKLALQEVVLMHRILASQLDIEKISRDQEGMLIQLLNDKLRVVSAFNCKSGLDRTGYWHAVKLAMLSQEKIDSSRAFRMVNNWERTIDLMHKIEAHGPHHLNACFNSSNASWDTIKKEIGDLLPEDISQENFEEWRQTVEDIMNFRQEVLKNMIEIGIPITAASSGLMGFKWNYGMQENLIPLNFLPPYVTTEQSGKTMTVPLIKFDSNGKILGITMWGRRFITKFQKMRGS